MCLKYQIKCKHAFCMLGSAKAPRQPHTPAPKQTNGLQSPIFSLGFCYSSFWLVHVFCFLPQLQT